MLLAINVGYCWRKWWMLWFRWWKRWWKGRGKETRGCNYCDRTGGNTGRDTHSPRPAVQTGIWIRACHFGFLLSSEKCGNVSFYYDIPPQIIRNEHKTKIISRKLPFNEVFFVHAVLILFSDCLWMITLSLIIDQPKVIQERVLSFCPIQTGWSSAHSSRDSKSWNNKRIPHIPWSACTWPSANWLLNERLPDWPGSTLTTEDLSSKNAFTFVKRMAVATFWWWGYTNKQFSNHTHQGYSKLQFANCTDWSECEGGEVWTAELDPGRERRASLSWSQSLIDSLMR